MAPEVRVNVDEHTGRVEIAPVTEGDRKRGGGNGGGGNGRRMGGEVVLRIVFWGIPLIFFAGAFYMTSKATASEVEQQSRRIEACDRRSQEMGSEQQLLKAQIGAIQVQQERMMEAMDRMEAKLSRQGEDLAAIREKLGVRPHGGDAVGTP